MNIFAYVVLGIIIIAVAVLTILRKAKANELNKSILSKDYDHVIEMCNNSFVRSLLFSRTCNLYLLRASFYKLDSKAFLTLLKDTVTKEEDESVKKEMLELYLHIYLYKDDAKSAATILELIDQMDHPVFIKVSHFCYDVATQASEINLEEMETMVEELRFFDLGVTTYYIAQQYDHLNNYDYAYAFYDACLGCLTENHVYAKVAQERKLALQPLLSDEE